MRKLKWFRYFDFYSKLTVVSSYAFSLIFFIVWLRHILQERIGSADIHGRKIMLFGSIICFFAPHILYFGWLPPFEESDVREGARFVCTKPFKFRNSFVVQKDSVWEIVRVYADVRAIHLKDIKHGQLILIDYKVIENNYRLFCEEW